LGYVDAVWMYIGAIFDVFYCTIQVAEDAIDLLLHLCSQTGLLLPLHPDRVSLVKDIGTRRLPLQPHFLMHAGHSIDSEVLLG
jgi:hypothetical protein